jgi:hypothetical protein
MMRANFPDFVDVSKASRKRSRKKSAKKSGERAAVGSTRLDEDQPKRKK